MGKYNVLDKVIVLDIEATCWEKENDRPKNETNEIIEVGLALVDLHSLRIEENGTIMVKPIQSKVSPFCTKLTTLTQADVDKGVSFSQMCSELRNHWVSEDRTWVSWGDYDRKQFEKQSRESSTKYPLGQRHLNLKNMFATLHGLDREIGMDKALDKLNLSMKGTHHRGVDDAYNIASIFIHTLKKFRNK